jgi:hypothetical protein
MLLLPPPRLSDVLEPETPGFRRRLKLNSNVREYNGANKNMKNVGTIRRTERKKWIRFETKHRTDRPPLLCGLFKKVTKSKMEQRLVVEPV